MDLKNSLNKSLWLLLLLVCPPLYSAPNITGALPERTLPQKSTLSPTIQTDSSSDFIESIVSPQAIDDSAFILNAVEVHGVTVYPEADIYDIFEGSIGKEITVSSLYGFANKITAKYFEDGFHLSQAFVPEQTVSDGVAQIWVVEGAIENISLLGDYENKEKIISRYLSPVLESRPLLDDVLERSLLLINDLPGVTATSYVIPGDKGLQNAELIVDIKTKDYSVFIGADNRGSKFFGRDQLYAGLTLNNQLGFGEKLEIAPMLSGVNDTEGLGGFINLQVPVGESGAYLQTYFAKSKSRPGGFLSPFDLEGDAVFASISLGYPLIRTMDNYLYFLSELDYVKAEEDIFGGQRFIEDAQSTVRIGLLFHHANFLDGELSGEVKLSRGLTSLGTRNSDNLFSSRVNASNDFTKLHLGLHHTQGLSPMLESFRLMIGFEGQYSNYALPASEEFGLGGPVFLRGYDSYEVSGDKAAALRAELKYEHAREGISPLYSMESFVFFDYGKIWNQSALEFEENGESLSSTGFGVRTNITRHIHTSVYFAKPLKRDVVAEGDDNWRTFLQLVWQY